MTCMKHRVARHAKLICLAGMMACIAAVLPSHAAVSQTEDDEVIATSLASMLRAGRTVISNDQDRINDPSIGDKGITGKAVLGESVAIYRKATGMDPLELDPASRQGRLLRAQMDAIVEVVDANQPTINAKGMGFKGFIPAVFARLVNEAFARRAGSEAEVKVTAPADLIRNRKSRPDAWEADIIKSKFLAPEWPAGQPLSATVEKDGRRAFRMMVPEYYRASCLSCHGTPKGEVDITGYPKEGRAENDLGGVISLTLYH
jgi:hypothetical protein